MSKEPALVNSYNQGGDIHALTASQIFNVPIGEVTASQRHNAKAVNFGVIYGISDYGLSQNLHIPQTEAKAYIDSYFERYPKIKEFNQECVDYARKNGYIRTKFGRIRHIPEINSSKYNLRSFAERVAMNMPLQGTASDIIKFAMIEVYKKLKENNLKSQLILQIHDELIVDVYPGEFDKVSEMLKNTMESVVNLEIPLIVNVGTGKNLSECKN
jgi:DNA polymerase-1